MGKKISILALTFAVLSFTQPAYAQQAGKLPRIGILMVGSPSSSGQIVDWFRQGLSDLGYVEGENFVAVNRWAMGKRKRLPALTKELIYEADAGVAPELPVGNYRSPAEDDPAAWKLLGTG